MQTVTRPVTKTTTVVRAISSHTAKAPREFSFAKEDCFYMLGGAAEGKDFIEVIHPKLRTPGLVPAYKFEFVPTTALNKVRNQNRKPKNVLAYVTSKTFKYNNEDLEASKGDPVLILEEIDENFYFAKLIGKVGAPGRIHKSQVELKEEVTQKAQRTESLSSLCALRKNNSTGNAPRTEKMRFMSSRRSDSTPSSCASSTPAGAYWAQNSPLAQQRTLTTKSPRATSSLTPSPSPKSRLSVGTGLLSSSLPSSATRPANPSSAPPPRFANFNSSCSKPSQASLASTAKTVSCRTCLTSTATPMPSLSSMPTSKSCWKSMPSYRGAALCWSLSPSAKATLRKHQREGLCRSTSCLPKRPPNPWPSLNLMLVLSKSSSRRAMTSWPSWSSTPISPLHSSPPRLPRGWAKHQNVSPTPTTAPPINAGYFPPKATSTTHLGLTLQNYFSSLIDSNSLNH
ncbi:bud emergence protein 1 [Entomophthora muscae]|uniref:Bud emergence protein 1 n=1 Tax=Entomophthora muscae TaxID=34485 RepID=A0ACC2UG10_9FUNG|nr:bud emergence protein 1 [Entomophthora muscae]